jgi:hypothetical protein
MESVAWIPGWYELDQPLEVGMSGEFAFWRIVPENLRGSEQLVLYNTLWHPEDAIMASGCIAAIRHPELGAIRKVDTRGLDYTLTLDDGTELTVNAEEEPGKIYERAHGKWEESWRVVTDWRCIVEVESLSKTRPA